MWRLYFISFLISFYIFSLVKIMGLKDYMDMFLKRKPLSINIFFVSCCTETLQYFTSFFLERLKLFADICASASLIHFFFLALWSHSEHMEALRLFITSHCTSNSNVCILQLNCLPFLSMLCSLWIQICTFFYTQT